MCVTFSFTILNNSTLHHRNCTRCDAFRPTSKNTFGPTNSRFEWQSSTEAASTKDKKTKERTFYTGDAVSVCSFPGDTWMLGTIVGLYLIMSNYKVEG